MKFAYALWAGILMLAATAAWGQGAKLTDAAIADLTTDLHRMLEA